MSIIVSCIRSCIFCHHSQEQPSWNLIRSSVSILNVSAPFSIGLSPIGHPGESNVLKSLLYYWFIAAKSAIPSHIRCSGRSERCHPLTLSSPLRQPLLNCPSREPFALKGEGLLVALPFPFRPAHVSSVVTAAQCFNLPSSIHQDYHLKGLLYLMKGYHPLL